MILQVFQCSSMLGIHATPKCCCIHSTVIFMKTGSLNILLRHEAYNATSKSGQQLAILLYTKFNILQGMQPINSTIRLLLVDVSYTCSRYKQDIVRTDT